MAASNRFIDFPYPPKRTDLLKIAIIFLILANIGGVANMFLPDNIIDVFTLLLCLPTIVYEKPRFSSLFFRILLIIWLVIFISALATNTSILHYKGLYLRTFLAYVIFTVFRYNFGELREYFYKAGRLICILGIVNFLLSNTVPDLFTQRVSSKGYSVHTIFYVFNWESELFFIKRNQGLYWEPGIFQIVLNLQLILILFEKSKSIKNAVVPIFLILTTGSTTGYFLLFFILIAKVVFSKGNKISFFSKLIIALFLISAYPLLKSNFENKFQGSSSQSAALRTYDFLMGIQTIIKHPLFGIGMDNQRYINQTEIIDVRQYYENAGRIDIERGNTNTLIYVGLVFGLPLAVLFYTYLYKQRIFVSRKIFFVYFVICLMSEPLLNNLFVMTLFLSGAYSKHIEKKHNYQKNENTTYN